MPITTTRETPAGLADQLAPRPSLLLITLIQNYAIAYAHGRDDIATEIEDAIALRLNRIENAGTFADMSTRARRTLLDCVLGDVSRPAPTSPLPQRIPGALLDNPDPCTCRAPRGAVHSLHCPLVGVPNPDTRP